MKEVYVTPARDVKYPIYLKSGWPDSPDFFRERLGYYSKLFLISQKGIEEQVLRKFLGYLPVDTEDIILLEQGEKNKHISNTPAVYNRLIERGADRHSVILALGGGVVGDFAGFIAATLLRGIRFVQIPSTLLAAVDSSVGGKTAVNADRGKNMIGAFHHPSFVYFNSDFLTTLAQKEWNCGLAEMVKHGFLDEASLKSIESGMERLRDPHSGELLDAIESSVRFKSSVVSRDEKETGLRSILNLGHTTGHAIESFTSYEVFSHGEAVSRGLVTALLLSEALAGLSHQTVQKLTDYLIRLGLPVDTAGIPAEDLFEHLKFDKKNKGGTVQFVLLRDAFSPVWGQKVERESFIHAWERQKKMFG